MFLVSLKKYLILPTTCEHFCHINITLSVLIFMIASVYSIIVKGHTNDQISEYSI